MTVYLIRHAKAGERGVWEDDDRLRPLSGRGHLQARGLLEVLEGAQFDRLLSSPYVRTSDTPGPGSASGAVTAIAVDPTNADRVFITSADGGVWRTGNFRSAQ